MVNSLTRIDARATVPTLSHHATKIRFSTVRHADVNVALDPLANRQKHLILRHVLASVHLTLALLRGTLTAGLVAVFAIGGIPVQRTRSLTKGPANANVPGWRSVGRRSDSIRIHVSVSALTIAILVQQIRFTTNENVGVSAGEMLRVQETLSSTTVVATVNAVVSARIRMFSTTTHVTVCVTGHVLRDTSSLTAANASPSHAQMQRLQRNAMLHGVITTPTSTARKF